MLKDDKMDEGAAAPGDHDLPDDLYDETEGVELRMSSPGPAAHSPVHPDVEHERGVLPVTGHDSAR